MKLLLTTALLVVPSLAYAQSTYEKAEVLNVTEDQIELQREGGQSVTTDNQQDREFSEGDTVIVNRITQPGGNTKYYIQEHYRLPSLLLLTGIFF